MTERQRQALLALAERALAELDEHGVSESSLVFEDLFREVAPRAKHGLADRIAESRRTEGITHRRRVDDEVFEIRRAVDYLESLLLEWAAQRVAARVQPMVERARQRGLYSWSDVHRYPFLGSTTVAMNFIRHHLRRVGAFQWYVPSQRPSLKEMRARTLRELIETSFTDRYSSPPSPLPPAIERLAGRIANGRLVLRRYATRKISSDALTFGSTPPADVCSVTPGGERLLQSSIVAFAGTVMIESPVFCWVPAPDP